MVTEQLNTEPDLKPHTLTPKWKMVPNCHNGQWRVTVQGLPWRAGGYAVLWGKAPRGSILPGNLLDIEVKRAVWKFWLLLAFEIIKHTCINLHPYISVRSAMYYTTKVFRNLLFSNLKVQNIVRTMRSLYLGQYAVSYCDTLSLPRR